jgi:hypothetical protein
MVSVLRSLRSGWIALAIALGAILLLQIWAGLTLRGLYADGAYYVGQILLRHSFAVVEHARSTSQILTQIPAVVLMWLGQDSAHGVAVAFSLATNVMPLMLTLACLVVLPPADRAFGLFPILIFLAASMSAAFASVADGPTATAYVWLLLLLILFGPLTRLRLGGILLLAVGTLRLHEAMAFIGPILGFACLWRCRTTTDRGSRIVLVLATLLIATGCAIAIHDALHPRIASNRASLIQDVVSLRWLLIGDGGVNIMALAGLTGVLVMPALLLPPRPRAWAMSAGLLVFAALTVLALTEPPCPAAAFAARDNACLLTAPAMVLLLLLRGRGWRLPAMSAMVMAVLGLTVATADATATAGWLSYTSAMRMALTTGHGVVPWRDAVAKLPRRQASALYRYAWPWTTPLMSLWLAPGPAITTIITNPSGVTWQPFNPDALRSVLARTDIAPTRQGVVALIGKKRRAHLWPGNARKAEPAPVETLGPLDRERQAGCIGDALGAAEEEGLGIGLIQLRLRRG